jgi:hypothetical protein
MRLSPALLHAATQVTGCAQDFQSSKVCGGAGGAGFDARAAEQTDNARFTYVSCEKAFLEFAAKLGLRAAARHFNVPYSTVRLWRQRGAAPVGVLGRRPTVSRAARPRACRCASASFGARA